jgi:hypothetical protein
MTPKAFSQNSTLTPSKQRPQTGFSNFGTSSMTPSKIIFKMLPLDWNVS